MFMVDMSYHNKNYIKRINYILQVYYNNKQEDIPDTFIVRRIFPKHNIYISYRTWMNIKNPKQQQVADNQLALF